MITKINTLGLKSTKRAFTLLELIVSITIFLIIIIVITSIFISSNEISSRTDINRVMQENVKNIIENISEDIRKYGISGVSSAKPDTDCNSSIVLLGKFESGNKLCTGNSVYYLAKKNNLGNYIRVDNMDNCSALKDICTLLKDGEPLSNSFITFRYLSFKVSKDPIKKVSINFIIHPSINKGIKPNLIRKSKIIFQTTISEKLIKTN